MAKAYDAHCLVLKHTKLGETDTIITLLDQDGRQIRAVAKGLRKPGNRIGARLELFSEVDILLHEGKSLDIVREVRSVCTNASIQEDLERVSCANVAAEMLDKLGRDGATLGHRLFDMSCTYFTLAGEVPPEKSVLLLSAFLFKAMAMQGFAPAVRECAICGNEIDSTYAFDIRHGGTICESCSLALTIDPQRDFWQKEWIEALLYCTFSELVELDQYPASELLELGNAWVREHADINLKSVIFLKSIL